MNRRVGSEMALPFFCLFHLVITNYQIITQLQIRRCYRQIKLWVGCFLKNRGFLPLKLREDRSNYISSLTRRLPPPSKSSQVKLKVYRKPHPFLGFI